MTREGPARLRVAAIALVLVVAVLATQAGADALAPRGRTETGAALGRAGFAYLGGIRVFAAVVLWNRVEPLLHAFYDDRAVASQTWVMPSVWLVVHLDPGLVEPFYGGAWLLVRRGRIEDGLALARRGVEENPRSGLLRVSYAQILWLYGKDLRAAVEQADLLGDAFWHDAVERYNGLIVVRTLYRKAGDTDKAAAVDAELRRMDEASGGRLSEQPAEEEE